MKHLMVRCAFEQDAKAVETDMYYGIFMASLIACGSRVLASRSQFARLDFRFLCR